MSLFKKMLSLIISLILLQNITTMHVPASVNPKLPVKAAVFLINLNDLFITDIKNNLEAIQKENENKIEFTFFDSKGNQAIENENIEKALNGFDILIVNPVTTKAEEIKDALNKIMQANIPLILYLPPASSLVNIIRPYRKGVIITGDVDQAGTLEGKILADAWNANRKTFDKNKDNIMQYVLLQGPPNFITTIVRTKYSLQTLNEAGIKTQQLLSTVCNWSKECAEITIDSAFLTLNGKIEAIISNNDDMAIGAINALQKYGYNKGDNSKYIPVVGIGGTPEAKKLINEGIMTGTVIEDIKTQVNAIYSIGLNLVNGNDPLDGTNFKFDETGITIKTPYYEYVK